MQLPQKLRPKKRQSLRGGEGGRRPDEGFQCVFRYEQMNFALIVALKRFHFREQAFNDRGVRSGPSDYVEAPRPFVYSRPPLRISRRCASTSAETTA